MSSLEEILKERQELEEADSIDNELAEQLLGDLKDKVDGIKAMIDRWDSKAEMLEDWASQINAKARTLRKKSDGLLGYARYHMSQKGYERLPGELWVLKWRKNPAKVEISIPADAKMFLQYGEVMRQKTSYTWDKSKLKQLVASEPEKYDFARIVQDKRLEFGVKDD